MEFHRWIAILAFSTGISAFAQDKPTAKPSDASEHNKNMHVVQCPESPVQGERPANLECAILVRKPFAELPKVPVMWRMETFPSEDVAKRAQSDASAIVHTTGKVWLLSISPKGKRSPDGTFVAEIGPLPIPAAPRYELLVAEGNIGSDSMNLPHTHSGPETWYLLSGEQCVETPNGTQRVRANEGTFVAAETPMKLTFIGPDKRDAFFIVVHDPALPWNTLSEWKPKDLCE